MEFPFFLDFSHERHFSIRMKHPFKWQKPSALTMYCQKAELNNISSTEYRRYIGGCNRARTHPSRLGNEPFSPGHLKPSMTLQRWWNEHWKLCRALLESHHKHKCLLVLFSFYSLGVRVCFCFRTLVHSNFCH